MRDTLTLTAPLTRWQGDHGTYHLVVITGEAAGKIALHARLHRLEFGKQRGFGSVKVMARIGGTGWNSSVFPQLRQSEWVLLVSKKVMRAEDLSAGDLVAVELDLI
jgi:hypothetical protein